jgi:hypothetical protein
VEAKRSASVVLVAGAACIATALVGCGGARQDASEPAGTYRVSIVSPTTFPQRQLVASHTTMSVTVKNDDTRTIPNLTLTVTTNNAGGAMATGSEGTAPHGFNYVSPEPGLSNPQRPVWIVDGVALRRDSETVAGPSAGTTAYTDTWSLGQLGPGATATFSFRLTPVKVGTWSVGYHVDAGLNGKAVAQLANGQAPTGAFQIRISNIPPQSRVDPVTGRVLRQPPAVAPGTPTQAAGEGQ